MRDGALRARQVAAGPNAPAGVSGVYLLTFPDFTQLRTAGARLLVKGSASGQTGQPPAVFEVQEPDTAELKPLAERGLLVRVLLVNREPSPGGFTVEVTSY